MTDTANAITAELLIKIPQEKPGWRVWRNNTGRGIGWSTVQRAIALIRRAQYAEAIKLLSSRPIGFGLVGSSDILGITDTGKLVAVEVKADDDEESEEQVAFRQMVTNRGGVALVARSVEGALQELRLRA